MIDMDKFGNKIFYSKFQILLKQGNILLNLGYFERKNKPNLFFKHIPEGWFNADMRGTAEVPIWEDTDPLFYWKFDDNVPFWKRRRLIEEEFHKLNFSKKSVPLLRGG
ncbi:MAG: hypothetical protein Q8N99_03705 [Nanoarchaeota archaeon]|nr:hypothetical protein [Nanoarchaeota archaeon]